MSWNITAKGTAEEVKAAVKADPGAQYMPGSMSLLIEELAAKAKGSVYLNTYGHVGPGRSEAHLIVEDLLAEQPKEAAPENPEEVQQAGS